LQSTVAFSNSWHFEKARQKMNGSFAKNLTATAMPHYMFMYTDENIKTLIEYSISLKAIAASLKADT
jgi:hypothetical protein